ncbi:hypothetical protein [Merismopedia glauca]|uniref:Uncharacterized protein n=2 Tax=Merismopedia TaxID=53402 RepID=A0A2T1C9T6_9CYAN|nr:hypothetical protein C7B64_01145 [Merismopedia glauca CCAP 1448/3]
MQTLQENWNRFQPALKQQTVKTLKGLDSFLQSTIRKLGADPNPPKVSPPSGGQGSSKSPSTAVVDKFLPSLEQIQRFWNVVLQKIRSLLPPSTSQKLSDWGLTGIIAGVAILVFWIGVAISSGDSPKQVAEVPSPQLQPPVELKAPNQPRSVKVVVPTPPPLQLTPEQSLIASIQDQVGEITKEYSNDLVQSLEVNFPKSRLEVKVGSGWYDLSNEEQDQITEQMLNRSEKFNFQKLQLTDPQGTLVARTPVVGRNMVILKRRDLSV